MTESLRIAISQYRFDDVIIDTAQGTVTAGGQQRHLGSRPFELLVYLIENRQRAVPKQELFDEVWGGHFVTDSALTQAIKEIRSALDDDANSPN